MFPSMEARSAYIRERLLKKSAKILALPEWKPYEMAELKYTLRELVKKQQAEKRRVEARLANLSVSATGGEPIAFNQ